MKLFLEIIGIILGFTVLYFILPTSPLRRSFNKEIENLKRKSVSEGMLTDEDIEHLPVPVKEYFRKMGYVGKPKWASVRILYKDVTFVMNGKNLPMVSDQYNFSFAPIRVAYMKSSVFGIPFEGRDRYVDGMGSMKGVLAKSIPLFNQKGEKMDTASLATYLSEILFLPSAAIGNLVLWEPISETQARAKITYMGIAASGLFTFNEKGEFVSFDTEDREMIGSDGISKKAKWSAFCGNYKQTNGLWVPTEVHATWHLDEGDLTYFKTDKVKFEYNS